MLTQAPAYCTVSKNLMIDPQKFGLILRNLGLAAQFRADILAPSEPTEWRISDFVNARIAFNHIIQADKPTLIWRVGRAA